MSNTVQSHTHKPNTRTRAAGDVDKHMLQTHSQVELHDHKDEVQNACTVSCRHGNGKKPLIMTRARITPHQRQQVHKEQATLKKE